MAGRLLAGADGHGSVRHPSRRIPAVKAEDLRRRGPNSWLNTTRPPEAPKSTGRRASAQLGSDLIPP
ncbi:hypothetical protein AAFF_G00433010 [Aldrovandia affinis]|uniref:Uncharacterized protein n=1 Tax=Aldrovandia affinis TaxID=143900 RepID=A0AAD7S8M5_9TELE|nr:hypothetical protein AAFF_G00433010 [Aldrovandia affinis]